MVVEGSPEESGQITPEHTQRSKKYLYDTNHERIIGINNSGESTVWLFVRKCFNKLIGCCEHAAGSKYAPSKKIQVSTIPYEERLERAIRDEEDARRKRVSV